MNETTVRKQVAVLAEKHGVRGLARLWGVDVGYISRVISGKRNPGPQILIALGLTEVVSYRRK